MKKLYYKMWWKWLGVALLLFALIAGFLIPLSPGIKSIYPQSANFGETKEFTIKGYNSNYSAAANNLLYLKLGDDIWLCGQNVKVIDNVTINATFSVPADLKMEREYEKFSVVISNKVDGYSILPEGPQIKRQAKGTSIIKECEPNLFATSKVDFPYRNQLQETIRNQFFHVSMWFAMTLLALVSLIHSIQVLNNKRLTTDLKATAFTRSVVLLGILGLATGSLWAKYAWNSWWNFDIKQTTAGIAVLIYMGYFVLRGSINDIDKRARISAVFNIFAFTSLVMLTFVIPRMTEASLHPGSGGNPGFGRDDLDNTMRMVFYPAVLGFTLIFAWMATLYYRTKKINLQLNLKE